MEKRITIYDIAQTAGVSPATVSRMIHQPDIVAPATREKILHAFSVCHIAPEDLSTKKRAVVSSQKGTGKNQSVLVSIPSLNNVFYQEVINGIYDYLHMFHYHMIITMEIPQRDTMQSFLNYCSSLHIAGIIVMYPLSEDSLRQLCAAYPLVQCSEHNPFYQNVPSVSIDDYSVSKKAVAHLIQEGCKKIGFFSSSFEFRYTQNRYRAYQSMLSSHNMVVRPEYLIQVYDFSYSRILDAAKQFYQLPDPPDAVFAISDEHAHAVVKAGEILGYHIPEDMKVFGFDDTMYATLSTPTISTVVQPKRELGLESAKILLDLIKHPDIHQESIILPTKLVIREST